MYYRKDEIADLLVSNDIRDLMVACDMIEEQAPAVAARIRGFADQPENSYIIAQWAEWIHDNTFLSFYARQDTDFILAGMEHNEIVRPGCLNNF